MRRTLFLLAVVVSLSMGAPVGAADDLIVSRFSDYLDSLRQQAGIPGLSVSLLRAGEADWEQGYGLRDIDRALPARPDTPSHLDSSTQLITTALVLRCVEDGRVSLDDKIGLYAPGSADPTATIRQLLSHTSGPPDRPVFAYNPGRLDPLAAAVASCTGMSFRATVADFLNRLAMIDSVPGADVLTAGAADGGITKGTLERFSAALDRLARPYAVDSKGRATASQYGSTTLTPGGGLIASARDMSRFDAALKSGVLVRPASLALAWTAPVDASGQRLPHGLGWFVQTYNGERIVWQFGVSDNASSSMIISIPGRGITLTLLANSQGLARPFSLAAGDVTVSPFARVFLSLFVR